MFKSGKAFTKLFTFLMCATLFSVPALADETTGDIRETELVTEMETEEDAAQETETDQETDQDTEMDTEIKMEEPVIDYTRHAVMDTSVSGTFKDLTGDYVEFSTKNYYSECGGEYSDRLILSSTIQFSGEPEPSLTKLGIALCVAAVDKTTICSALDTMGYTNVRTYNYTRTKKDYADVDYGVFSVGQKQVKDGDDTYTLYIVTLRGEYIGQELPANMDIGYGSVHKNFYQSAAEVLNTLGSDFFSCDGSDASHRKILVTGYGRGAGIGNVVAGKLTEGYGGYFIDRNIHGYTYSCQNVSMEADPSLANIYNFNYSGDPYTLMPLSSWGFKRYGKTITLTTEGAFGENFTRRYGQKHVDGFPGSDSTNAEILAKIAKYDTPEGRCPEIQSAFLLASRYRAHINNEYDDGEVYHLAGMDFVGGRSGYASDMITTIQSFMTENVNLCSDLYDAVQTTLDYTEAEFDNWTRGGGLYLLGRCQTILPGNPKITTYGELLGAYNASVNLRSKNAYAERVMKAGSLFYSLMNDAIGNPLDSSMDAHMIDNYVTRINSNYFGYDGWKKAPDTSLFAVSNCGYTIGHGCFEGAAITGIAIPDKVEYLGSSAFEYCESLEGELTLPRSLFGMGERCFYNCAKLTGTIELPTGVREILENCFYKCSGLEELFFHDDVKCTYKSSFSGCTGLKKVTVPLSMDYEGGSTQSPFTSCSNIEEIYYLYGDGTASNAPRTIPYAAARSLKKVTYDDMIQEIPDSNLEGCEVVEEVYLPANLKKVGACAFYRCASWANELNLPQGVEEIGDQAFSSCQKVAGPINLPANLQKLGKEAFNSCYLLTGPLVIPEAITEIQELTFRQCKSIEEVVIHDGVTNLGRGAFTICTGLKKVTMPVSTTYNISSSSSTFYQTPNVEEIYYTAGTGEVFDYSENYHYGLPVASKAALKTVIFEDNNPMTEVIPDGEQILDSDQTTKNPICKIIPKMFYDCTVVETIQIPSTIETIGEYAFYNCKKWDDELFLPSCLTEIGEYAYNGCAVLTSDVVFPDGLTTLGKDAFADCKLLTGSIVIPECFTTVEEGIFRNCPSLTEVVIHDGVTEIGNTAFYGCSGLKKITLPMSAVYNNTRFYGSFASTGKVEEIIFTKGDGTLYKPTADFDYQLTRVNNSSLRKITLPDEMDTIVKEFFRGQDYLRSIRLPENLKEIHESAFYWSTGIREITFTGDAPAIDARAFSSTSVTAYYPGDKNWPESALQNYGGNIKWVVYYTNPTVITTCADDTLTAKAYNTDRIKEHGIIISDQEDATLETPGRTRIAFTEYTTEDEYTMKMETTGYYRAYIIYDEDKVFLGDVHYWSF